jgi:hypothetical protein
MSQSSSIRFVKANQPAIMPWKFALASPESRAAARAMLEARQTGARRLQLVTSIQRPRQDNSLPRVGDWTPIPGGRLMRLVYIPPDIGCDTRERILATP